MKIKKIEAEKIKDSRGKPTIKAIVECEDGSVGSFAVPSGASTGTHEAHVLDVQEACASVNDTIAKALIGMDVTAQKELDQKMLELDGTQQKSNLGGNAMIGVSIALAKAAAVVSGVPLYQYLRTLRSIKPSRTVPMLFMNVINGGKHAKGGPAFQEYHIIPDTDDVAEAKKIGEEFMLALDQYASGMGDEGGIIVRTDDPEEPLRIIKSLGTSVKIGLDVAASSFYDKETNLYRCGDRDRTPSEMHELYGELIKKYNLYSVEDPFQEEAFDDFALLQKNTDSIIIGDDLTVTNVSRLNTAIKAGAIRAMIIKPNQIGTLTETLNTMELARTHDIHCIVSHRSGDTLDSAIADIAYAFGTLGLKCGVPRQPERVAKIDRLIQISHE
ncbi:MAG: enolase C-terminal domain-like protein [Patescibacteria group bacterium]